MKMRSRIETWVEKKEKKNYLNIDHKVENILPTSAFYLLEMKHRKLLHGSHYWINQPIYGEK